MELWKNAFVSLKPKIAHAFALAAGAVIALLGKLPPLGRVLLAVQAADVLTGLACAALGKSPKTGSGLVSSRVMLEGAVRKGTEWLAAGIGVLVGEAAGVSGAGGMMLTYLIATELVSLLENFALLGVETPLLFRMLDVLRGKSTEK